MVSAAELVGRARDLAPVLVARAQEAEALRQLPEATMTDLRNAGFFPLLVPRRFGGHELDYLTLIDIGRELGRGCASSAWVAVFFMLHNWLAAMWPEETQAELWADRPYMLAPGALAPVGVAEVEAGGFRLSGRWPWGTGVMHCDWAMVAAPLDTGGITDRLMFLLPRTDFTVIDVWHTDGMRGTGTNDIVAESAFVPARRVVSSVEIAQGRSAGILLHRHNPLYRLPLSPALALAAAAPAVGAAEAALDFFRQRLSERVLPYSGGVTQRDRPAAQIRLARATTELWAARLLYDDATAELTSLTEAATLHQRARLRMAAAHVVGVCRRVVWDLAEASGAGAHFLDSPLQRTARDLGTLSGHVVYDWDAIAELFGRLDLGLEPPRGALL